MYIGSVRPGVSIYIKNPKEEIWGERRHDGSVAAPCAGVMLRAGLSQPKTLLSFVPTRDLVAVAERERIPTLRYEPDLDALGKGRIPQEMRTQLFNMYLGAQMEGECLCFCFGVRLALDRDDLQRPGPTSVHRTTMHAAHVEVEAKMKQMEEEGHDISTCIENLRPTCASCNGDMRTFNLFSFIDVVGGFMKAEMEKWTRWFRSL